MKIAEMLAFVGLAHSGEPIYGTRERRNVGRSSAKKNKTKAQRKARRASR